jgi:tetratricopeptide (TPR) repeat protein
LPVLAQLGFAFYQLKRASEAEEVLASASSLAPSNPDILYLTGLVVSLRGDADGAVACWQKALEQRPDFAAANFMIGEELRKQRRYEGAIEFYQKALDQDAGQLAYYVRPAGTFMLLTRYDRALELFQKAAERFPKSAEAQYFVGIAARGLANLDLAEASFRKSLALKDGNVDALAQLGFVLDERGQIAEAEKVLRRAVATDARHFFANYDLGRVLVHAKQYEEALDMLMAAGRIRPRDPGVHYQLFMAYTRLKRKDDADRELKLFKQYETESKSQRSDPNAQIEDSLPRPKQDPPD